MVKLFYGFLVLFFINSCLNETGTRRPPIALPCSSDLDCNDDKICTSKNFCADCEEDAHCDGNLICSNYSCKIPGTGESCTKHSDCNNVPNKPKCDTNIKSCVACLYGITGDDSCPDNKTCSENNTCVDSSPPPTSYFTLGSICTSLNQISTCKYNTASSSTFNCKCSNNNWIDTEKRWVIIYSNLCSRTITGGTSSNRYNCEKNLYCTESGSAHKCYNYECTKNAECNFNSSKTKCKTSTKTCVQCLSNSDCTSFQQTPECNTSQGLCVASAGQECNDLLSSCEGGPITGETCSYPGLSYCVYNCGCIGLIGNKKWKIPDHSSCDFSKANACASTCQSDNVCCVSLGGCEI